MTSARGGTWVTKPDDGPAFLSVRRFRLHVVDGPDKGLCFDSDSSMARIGGGAIADLRLSDRRVSGLHAELSVEEQGFRLRDLGSSNGTFVGELRVNDALLSDAATLRLGDTVLEFSVLGDAVELPLAEETEFGDLVGQSAAMRAVFARLGRLAASDISALIVGETGTGKDLAAEAIHRVSGRTAAPLVIIDCGAIPANLIESELFGHERGAFTGATSAHAGAFERADGGTVFLDEIGELPLEMQPKLLRVLERRQVRRLGGAAVIDINVRVVAATNRDLPLEVSRGQFREDLYYRLAVATVRLPPLRERREDIPLLVDIISRRVAGGEPPHFGADALNILARHDWPGNVRELRNVLERVVFLDDAPHEITALGQGAPRASSSDGAGKSSAALGVNIDVPFKQAKSSILRAFEREYVTRMLERHEGNVSAASRAAGVDRTVIYKIIERHHLKRPK